MTLRVLHVLPHRGGGAETFLDLLEALPDCTHERVPLSASRAPADAVRGLPRRLPMLLRARRDADVVHVHGDAAALLSLPLLASAPSVFNTHGLHLLRRAAGARGRAVRTGLAAAVRAAAVTICSSQAERDELEAVLPQGLHGRLAVVRNATVLPPEDPERRRAARAELGLAAEAVAGLFLGRLEARKDPLTAVLAASSAARRTAAPFVLLVAGAGPLEADVRAAAAGEAVRVLGFRSDPQRLLAAADLAVMPSRREGQSFAVLEAMAHGLPTVVADGPGNAEAIGDAGVVVPAGSAEALAEVFAGLADDPAFRARLGRRARERVATEFAPATLCAGVADAYATALRGVRAPAPGAGAAHAWPEAA